VTPEVLEQEWQTLVTMLPPNLEQLARASGALERRRELTAAQDLVRLAFVYSFCGLSLRSTASWAYEQGLADFSDVALLKRLKNSAPFLGQLLTEKLAQCARLPALDPDRPRETTAVRRVRLVDATCVSRPGATGTDWRIHLGLDLRTLCIDHAELTDASGGETLARLPILEGDLLVADRGYSHRRGLVAVVKAGGHVIVRLNWHNLPLQDPDGQPFNLLAALRTLAAGEIGEWKVQTAPDPKERLPAVEGRLIALAKRPAEAEAARRQIRKQAKKKGRTPSRGTLEAAGYVFVFTTLSSDQLGAVDVLELYRFRWQVEMVFKRMKGLLALGKLAARNAALCRATLLTKLLGALLVGELSGKALTGVALSPWGYGTPRPGGLLLESLSGSRRHAAAGRGGGLDAGAVGGRRPSARRRAARGAAATTQSSPPIPAPP
jgi:Transposase DDE domain